MILKRIHYHLADYHRRQLEINPAEISEEPGETHLKINQLRNSKQDFGFQRLLLADIL